MALKIGFFLGNENYFELYNTIVTINQIDIKIDFKFMRT